MTTYNSMSLDTEVAAIRKQIRAVSDIDLKIDSEPMAEEMKCLLVVPLKVVVEVDENGRPRYAVDLEFELTLALTERRADPRFRVRPGKDCPFHPYFDPETGCWNSDSIESRPPNLQSWIIAFLRSLCYGFAHETLREPAIKNPQAAEWYQKSVRESPGRFPTDGFDFFEKLRDEIRSPDERGLQRGPRKRNGRSRFRMRGISAPYEPRERKVPDLQGLRRGCCSDSLKSRHHLTIQGVPANELFRHIGWNRKTAENRVEQGGILLGHVYCDRERDLVCGVVGGVVPAHDAKGSGAHLRLDTDVWKEMLDYVDRELERDSRELQIIGWYHTHPGQLGVFMSETDCVTQRRFFSQEWHFALVLNPHCGSFKVFHGRQAAECTGNIYPEGTLLPDEMVMDTAATSPASPSPDVEGQGPEGRVREPEIEQETPPEPPVNGGVPSRGDSADADPEKIESEKASDADIGLSPAVVGVLLIIAIGAIFLPWNRDENRLYPGDPLPAPPYSIGDRGGEQGVPMVDDPKAPGPPRCDRPRYLVLREGLPSARFFPDSPAVGPLDLEVFPGARLDLLEGARNQLYRVRLTVEGWVRRDQFNMVSSSPAVGEQNSRVPEKPP